MSIERIIDALENMAKRITTGVYRFHLQLMKSERFDGTGVHHPHPEIQAQFFYGRIYPHSRQLPYVDPSYDKNVQQSTPAKL